MRKPPRTETGAIEITVLEDAFSGAFWPGGSISPTNFVLAPSSANLAAIQAFDALPTNLDLTLQPGIMLSGSVDTKADPISNTVVAIHILAGNFYDMVQQHPIRVDTQGRFTIPALPQGREYRFFDGISAKGYGTAAGQVDAGTTKTNHYEFPPFVLKRTDRILAGKVLGPAGQPLAGATVELTA